MDKTSSLSYLALTSVIYVIRSVTFASYAVFVYLSYAYFAFGAFPWLKLHPLLQVFCAWMFAEAVFYPYALFTHSRLQRVRESAHACANQAERMALLERCFEAMSIATGLNSSMKDAYLNMVCRWFYGATPDQVHRGNMEEWAAWAFLYKDTSRLNSAEIQDVDQLVARVEEMIGYKFPPGYTKSVRCIRTCHDPVLYTQRPLIVYIVMVMVRWLGRLAVIYLGFQMRSVDGKRYYYRPANPSCKEPSYANKNPVVFSHGIGIGFCHYIGVIASLPDKVDVYLLEFPSIIMKIGAEQGPCYKETTDLVRKMLHADGHDSACFVGHSFGTAIVAWMLRSREAKVRALVSSFVVVDPIVFLINDPSLVNNFFHKEPSRTSELLIRFFLARELYIANTFSRHFSWSHAILFGEDFPGKQRCTVILSEDDVLVPSLTVKAYLDGWNRGAAKNQIDVVCVPNTHHGELMVRKSGLALIASKVLESCGAAPLS